MTIDIRKSFSNNLRNFRKARGLSQEKFAELVGIENSTLSKIECGKSYPNRSTLEKIIEVLNIQPYMLYILNENEFDLDKAYSETIVMLEELKNNQELFKLVYDFTRELCNKNNNI